MIQNDRYTEYMDGVIREITEKVIYSNEEVFNKWKEVRRQKGTSAYLHRRKELQQMLTICGIDWKNARTEEEWEACIRQVPSSDERDNAVFSMLYEVYRSFPTADSYMERLVRRLGDPVFQGDSVRLAIVKQFIKETDHETERILQWAKDVYSLTGEVGAKELRDAVLEHLQEDVFDLLEEGMPLPSLAEEIGKEEYEQKIKDTRAKNRSRYPLLRMADDFQEGRHRKSANIKKELYLFAFAFSMTVSAENPDPVTDIEKNLFYDYYQDSLLKYISDDYRRNAAGIEKEPSGEGINYKNYAEVIILYALSRKNLAVRERMLLAERLTEECTRKGRRRAEKERPLFTEVYKAYFFQDIQEMEEEEVAEYIMKNFDIPQGTRKNTVWDVVSAQVTAEHITRELLWDLKEAYQEQDISISIKNWTKLNYGLDTFRKDKDFMKIMEKLHSRLQIKKERKEWLEEQMAAGGMFQEMSDPTRLELITACFYRYYFSERGSGMSLPQLIEDFCFEVDPLLEACRYQKISTKNIFDMFALFMLYSISV